jgi:hypothetical protein
MRTEELKHGHIWLRLSDPKWENPTDPHHAAQSGGRWNPAGSFDVLYLNEDIVTARLNLQMHVRQWPYEPEDLRPDTAPVLVHCTLPAKQRVLDVHTPKGVAAVGLPASYPLAHNGDLVAHAECQPIGENARAAGLRGVRSRSAQSPMGAGRELAWFPATGRSRASVVKTQRFADWFWA